LTTALGRYIAYFFPTFVSIVRVRAYYQKNNGMPDF